MNLDEFEEIKTEDACRPRCQITSNGRPVCIATVLMHGAWIRGTHELVPHRHKVSGETVLIARKLMPLVAATPCEA